jgi:hypothetical protein
MTLWLVVLAVVMVGAGVVAFLTARATRDVGPTLGAFDDLRRDLRLAVVELRVERDRVARRVDDLDRRSHGNGRR